MEPFFLTPLGIYLFFVLNTWRAKQGNRSALQTPRSSCIFKPWGNLWLIGSPLHTKAFIVHFGDDKDMLLDPPKAYTPAEESACEQISYKYTLISAMLGKLV